MRLTILLALATAMFPSAIRAQAPVFEITPVGSTITFDVEASVAITGKFNKWNTTLTFTSPELFDRRFGHQDSGRHRGYRKRHEERKAKGRQVLRCREKSANHLSLLERHTNRTRHDRVRWRIS